MSSRPPSDPLHPDLLDSLELDELRPFEDDVDDIEGRQLLARIEANLFAKEQPPQKLGRWIILERLGAGSMGVVYAAYDPRLDRRVALKVLRSKRSASEGARARMLREAQALAKISDPHVVQIHDVEELEDNVCLVMELIDGPTLRQWQSEPRSLRELLDRYVQVAHGLATVHEAGLVHRDVKPDNVLIKGDRVVIADFGLVFAGEGAALDGADLRGIAPTAVELSLTADDTLVGTLGYMAPEQLSGRRATAQSDQFAFCVSLHEALTGARPFRGKTPAEIVAAMVSGPLARAKGTALPRWLFRLLCRGLKVEPTLRFASMAELRDALAGGRNRGRRARNLLLLAGGLGLAGLGYGLRQPAGDPCSDPRAELAPIWGDARRELIYAQVLGNGSEPRKRAWRTLAISFERAAEQWSQAWVDECRERSTPNPTAQERRILAARRMCLRAVESKLRAFSDTLSSAQTQTLDAAATQHFAGALAKLRDCNNPSDLDRFLTIVGNEPDPARAQDLQDQLDLAHAQETLGEYSAAERGAAAVVAQAQAHGITGLKGEALFRRGRNLDLLGRPREAREALQGAAELAARHHDHDLGARSSIYLAKMLADDPQGGEGGRGWLLLARNELLATGEARPDDQTWSYADYLEAQGLVAFADQHYPKAEALHRAALDVRIHLAAPETTSVDLIKSKNNLASVLSRLGPDRKPEALALYEDALDDAQTLYGADHPFLAEIWFNIGIQQRDAKRPQLASRALKRAVELDRSTRGRSGAPALRALFVLGVIASDERDQKALDAVAVQIEQIHQHLLADDPEQMKHIDRADELKLVAQARADDDVAAAIDALRRAADILEPLNPVEHAWTLIDLAQFSIAEGKTTEARASLQEALGVLRQGHDPVDAPSVAAAEELLTNLSKEPSPP